MPRRSAASAQGCTSSLPHKITHAGVCELKCVFVHLHFVITAGWRRWQQLAAPLAAAPPAATATAACHVTYGLCCDSCVNMHPKLCARCRSVSSLRLKYQFKFSPTLNLKHTSCLRLPSLHSLFLSAMVASWVSQASFEPLGLTIAVAKDRAIESMMQVR